MNAVSEFSEDEIKVESNEKELKQNKSQTGTCELRGKTMLIKNLKYAHPKVCKNRPRPPSPPPPPPPSIIIERVVVNTPSKSDTHENVKPQVIERPKTLEEQYQEQRLMKNDLRKQRIKSLIANAF